MNDDSSIDLLSRALDQTTDLLTGVRPDQMDDPTPCRDWAVRDLIAHIATAPRNFVTMNEGGDVDWSARPPVPDDFATAFRADADDLLQSWHDTAPGSADFQIAEFAVHSWDLAQAVGRTDDLDPDIADRALRTMSGMLKPEMRGGAFAPEATVSDDAPVYERLAAFAGRTPS